MIKNRFLVKNFFYLVGFVVLTLFFVAFRCFQLCYLTNLTSGICYEIRIFDVGFILVTFMFLAFSFLFFKFIYRPTFSNFESFEKSRFVGFVSFLLSIVVLFSSFSMLFGINSKNSISAPFNLFFSLTGFCFSIGLAVLAICLVFDLNFLQFGLKFVFYSAFFWGVSRFFSLMFTDAFLHYANVEYKFSVLGLVCIFLFFYYFGRLALNYNGKVAGCGFLTFGFSSVFVIFANVVPKLFLNFYVWFFADKFKANGFVVSSFFDRNINLFNFYNFSLVDFFVSLFIFSFVTVFVFSGGKKSEESLN